MIKTSYMDSLSEVHRSRFKVRGSGLRVRDRSPKITEKAADEALHLDAEIVERLKLFLIDIPLVYGHKRWD
jgi:hypothetical protein